MKKTIDTNYTFSSETRGKHTLPELCQMMSRHVTACGVTVSADECAHVISAMASHRLLYVEGSGEGDVMLANAIASFLGHSGNATVCKADTGSLSALMGGKDVNEPLADKLRAITGTGSLGAVVIDNREGADLSGVLAELEGYFSDENETHEVRVDGGSIVLPKNAYFIFVLPEGRGRELIGNELYSFACPIVCDRLITLVTNEDEMLSAEIKAEEFSELVRDAYLKLQPSDEDWARIDRIDALLSLRIGMGFGNDGYLTMEKYVSVFNACTGDYRRAIDVLVAEHVSAVARKASKEDGEALCSLLSSMTNELPLPKAQNAASMLAR